MVNEIIHNELKTIIKNWMDLDGISNYKLEIDGWTVNGENYMTEIIFFKVIIEDEAKTTYSLVMKTAKRAKELRENFPITLAYNKEILTYSEVFTTFKDFLKEVNPSFKFDLAPEMYWSSLEKAKETIILQNMLANGYKLLDRTKPWDLKHSLFVMENYGKFHAISFALKDQKPDIFQKLAEKLSKVDVNNANNIDFKEFYEVPWRNMMKAVKEAGRDDLLRKFNGFEETLEKAMVTPPEEGDKLVITHGDCWSNNFMFKYQNENDEKPSKVCFLDFQMQMVDSPAKDLSYNIYSTCDKSCLDHFDLLLQTYYDSLIKTAEDFGSNLKNVFTYDDLKRHWKKYANYGLIMSIVITKAALLKNHEAPDLEKMAKEGKNPNQCFHFTIENEDEYNRRMLDVLSQYAEFVL